MIEDARNAAAVARRLLAGMVPLQGYLMDVYGSDEFMEWSAWVEDVVDSAQPWTDGFQDMIPLTTRRLRYCYKLMALRDRN